MNGLIGGEMEHGLKGSWKGGWRSWGVGGGGRFWYR